MLSIKSPRFQQQVQNPTKAKTEKEEAVDRLKRALAKQPVIGVLRPTQEDTNLR